MADIPGLIEGAHEGAGSATAFLGHVERCRVLLHLVDGTQEDPAEAYRIIRGELKAYDQGLADKIEIVAMTKVDAMNDEVRAEKMAALAAVTPRPPYAISAASGEGVGEVLREIMRAIGHVEAEKAAADLAAAPAEGWHP